MGITRTGNGLVHEMDTLLNNAARPKDAFGLFPTRLPLQSTLLGGKMPGMRFGKAAPDPASGSRGKTAWDSKIPRLLETRYHYNAKGLLTLTCQGSRFVRYTYNDQDLVTSISDALGRTTRFLYNSKGQLRAVEMPDGGKIAFSYDEAGHLSAISTPLGATHGLDLDASDLDTAYKAPLSGVYRQIYDTKGRVVKKEFPSGKTISYSYKDDALVLVKLPEGEVKLSYGPDGLTRVSMGREAVTYRYEQGLLAGEWRLGTLERELAYKYGKNGRLASFAYSGAVQSYEYDEKGRLVRAGSFVISQEPESGLAISVSDSNVHVSRQYNQYGELNAQTWTVAGLPATWWSVERDAAGRIVRKVQVAGGQATDYAYGYDAGGRLLQVKKDGAIVEEYRYNADGARAFEFNRLAGISGRAYSYDGEGRLIAAGNMRFAYNPDGFLARKTDRAGVTSYAYASRGGLLRVDIPGGTVVEYVNDPFGRRIAKKVNGNIVEKYL
ncbi:MAG: hypothetical protein QMD09_11730, partial [Desulfatibacillaceae bacterium]|nr:hypothetical protein [Desulfatibacillaceae bacterium]